MEMGQSQKFEIDPFRGQQQVPVRLKQIFPKIKKI